MQRRNTSAPGWAAMAWLGLGLMGACHPGADPAELEGVEMEAEFEALKAQTARDINGRTVYMVEWDLALNEAQLRRYYRERVSRSQAVGTDERGLTIHQVGGQDDRWSREDGLDLTYCVSTAFGTDQARAIEEMADATARWMRVANVRFRYQPNENGTCTAANPDIDIPVRPWNQGGACAFFPSGGGCVAGTLVIDFDDLDTNPFYQQNSPEVTTTGVFTHELGHVLGFRHEHIRDEAAPLPFNCSSESNLDEWRTLTAYDAASTMHYPWCNGVLESDLSITPLDAEGGRVAYGLPSYTFGAVL